MTVENLEIEVASSASSAAKELERMAASLSKIKAPSNAVNDSVKGLTKSIDNSTNMLKKFTKSIGRIAFYRAIRTAVKEVNQSFQEGLKNAYHFSKGIGGDLARALDTISTKSLTMKNQLGSAFGGLIQAIEPILLKIIELVRRAANALAQFFAILGGKSTYLMATDAANEWDKATGAANKYKNTILGFDEINRLDEPSGGGGGAALDYSKMFEEVELAPWAQKLSEWLDGFNQTLEITIDDVLFKWKNLTGEQIAKKCVAGLGALLGGAVGFAIGGVPGALIGTLTGLALGLIFDSIYFNNDGVLSDRELCGLLIPALSAICGGLIGFAVGGVPGALLGLTIAVTSKLVLDKILKFDANGNLDKQSLYDLILPALTMIVGGLVGLFIGNIPGALIGLSIGALLSFTFQSDESEFISNTKMTAEQIFNKMKSVFDSVFMAMLFASIALGSGGLLVLTLGLKLVFTVLSTDFNEVAKARDAAEAATHVSLGNAGLPTGTPYYNPTKYADGGFPSRGDLFIAGEAGAELVSSNNGQTQVSNTDQIANSVQVGNGVVVQAIYDMANTLAQTINAKDTNPVVTIGDREVYRAAQRGGRAVGGSLVNG